MNNRKYYAKVTTHASAPYVAYVFPNKKARDEYVREHREAVGTRFGAELATVREIQDERNQRRGVHYAFVTPGCGTPYWFTERAGVQRLAPGFYKITSRDVFGQWPEEIPYPSPERW